MRRRSAPIVDRQWGSRTALGSRIPLVSLLQTLAVAEHLNFRHAAHALGVSLSSISTRVKTLEQDLGVLLFERHARGVRLTEAGRHFVRHVAAGVDHLEHAVKAAGMAASGECGRIRIGVHALSPGSFLTDLIGRYRSGHPGIEVLVTESTARDAVMQVRSDQLDIAFVAGLPELSDCHSRLIWTEPLMVALPKGHALVDRPAVTWADLAGQTFLVRYGGTGPQVHDHIVMRLAGRWPASSIQRFEVERSTLLSMVAQGFGITINGAGASLLTASDLTFLPLADELKPVSFSAVWSPFNRGSHLRNLLDLANRMKRSPSSGYSSSACEVKSRMALSPKHT